VIIFNKEAHSYTNVNTGEKYSSVTTILNQFKIPFDKDGMSRIVAARRGISQEDIIKEWDETANKAKDYGTKIHSVVEEYIKNGTHEDEYATLINNFKKQGSLRAKDGVLCEHIVHNHQYKIAGTADMIVPTGKYFDVLDIKTNKKFNYYSPYDKFLTIPVEHLTECEHNTYALQLSMYAYFYHLLTGRKVRHLSILFLDKTTEDFTRIPINYLESDVKAILNTYERKK